ncbi:LacI family DNA-binding transcriptional regulator [Bifidobacterium phasiani]|uniref:LacI family DNA-binding transcriptional regulator n=1 Tax=Bifidobacterium phasiani TaxID=2834431 RepID=A0ABS6W8N9_9BIFI|nr:LacI family DNA-binding transcriptional regulator [Bifidobacterium phasiani]MBW3082111.1 LacI family DNA-binding transcriptional regulator [Bifidobacterium phasiani]
MVTLDDVAARAGVSRMTASNALRGRTVVRPETACKVIAAAKELGYHPNIAARQLSSGRTQVIGLTVADFDLIFPAALAAAVSDQAQALGYQVIVQQTRFSHDFERRMLSSATSQICDGTIICWPSSVSAEMESFARTHPLVLLDGFGLEGRCDCVFTPCTDGMAAAARHLIGHGCRRVLTLGGGYLPPERFDDAGTSEQRRVRGAAEGLLAAGLPYRADDVYPCDWTREAGYRRMRAILDERRDFDGVCCLNDPIAIGALKALAEAGVRVPQDVAVTGFDGVEDGQYLTPGLTSVAIDPQEAARVCLELLMARIERDAGRPPAPRTVDLGYRLASRGSGERT